LLTSSPSVKRTVIPKPKNCGRQFVINSSRNQVSEETKQCDKFCLSKITFNIIFIRFFGRYYARVG
jgi:hypothetical protein